VPGVLNQGVIDEVVQVRSLKSDNSDTAIDTSRVFKGSRHHPVVWDENNMVLHGLLLTAVCAIKILPVRLLRSCFQANATCCAAL
jgi:hypothetical protein